MGNRFVMSWQNLQCENLIGIADPVSVTTNAAGAATATNINTKALSKAIHKIESSKSEDDSHDNASRSLQAME